MGFEEDLETLHKLLADNSRLDGTIYLEKIVKKLRDLAAKRVISSNHTAMELVLSSYLLDQGYEVEVEHKLSSNLICDIYASSNKKTLIVEVETGYVPPENSLDPALFRLTRDLSKIARYSRYSDEFALATPPYHILYVPSFLINDNKMEEDILKYKKLIDLYYKNPPLSLKDLMEAKLDKVYVVIVDELKVIELSAREYYERYSAKLLNFIDISNIENIKKLKDYSPL